MKKFAILTAILILSTANLATTAQAQQPQTTAVEPIIGWNLTETDLKTMKLGDLFLRAGGEPALDRIQAKANAPGGQFGMFVKKSKQDNVAPLLMGIANRLGYFTGKTAEAEKYYYTVAADLGNFRAMEELAKLLPTQEALPLLRKAAEAGYPGAMNNYGFALASGEGANQDMDAALRWFRKSSELGNSVGTFNVGMAFLNGNGVPKDVNQAITWFQRAVDTGDASAMQVLGKMYVDGDGVPQDRERGIALLDKASAYGSGVLSTDRSGQALTNTINANGASSRLGNLVVNNLDDCPGYPGGKAGRATILVSDAFDFSNEQAVKAEAISNVVEAKMLSPQKCRAYISFLIAHEKDALQCPYNNKDTRSDYNDACMDSLDVDYVTILVGHWLDPDSKELANYRFHPSKGTRAAATLARQKREEAERIALIAQRQSDAANKKAEYDRAINRSRAFARSEASVPKNTKNVFICSIDPWDAYGQTRLSRAQWYDDKYGSGKGGWSHPFSMQPKLGLCDVKYGWLYVMPN